MKQCSCPKNEASTWFRNVGTLITTQCKSPKYNPHLNNMHYWNFRTNNCIISILPPIYFNKESLKSNCKINMREILSLVPGPRSRLHSEQPQRQPYSSSKPCCFMVRDAVMELLCHFNWGDNHWLHRRETITSQRRVRPKLEKSSSSNGITHNTACSACLGPKENDNVMWYYNEHLDWSLSCHWVHPLISTTQNYWKNFMFFMFCWPCILA